MVCCLFFFFKQKTAYEMRISDWSSDVCSSDLPARPGRTDRRSAHRRHRRASPGLSPMKLLDQPIDLIGIATIARAVREGRLSAVALIESRLARIERLNPRLNAFSEILADRARREAEAVEIGRAHV